MENHANRNPTLPLFRIVDGMREKVHKEDRSLMSYPCKEAPVKEV